MVVRNEEALIEHNVRYHLANGFDIIALLDHCSTDRTSKILTALATDERVKILRSDDPVFDHGKLSNLLLQHLLQEYEVDWIFPLDADEFFYSPGGVHAFLQRMLSNGIKYGTIPWLNAVMINHRATSDGTLYGIQFYRPWPERDWQHRGMFRKAFCGMHDGIEIVVGGHYFRKEVNSVFFAKEPAPVLLQEEEACIYHYEFRGSIQALMAKWILLANHEHDSSSGENAPWLERLERIQSYVEQWYVNQDAAIAYWTTMPRTFWGTPIPSELILEHHYVASWIAQNS